MVNRRLVLGFIAIALLLLLAATVPSEASFRAMLTTEAREHAKSLLGIVVGAIASTILTQTVTYHNYVLFATAETRVGSSHTKYIGLLGNWFPISREQEPDDFSSHFSEDVLMEIAFV